MIVTLKKDHTHAGKDYPAGAEIDVPPHDAEWLAANEVIDPLPDTKRGPAAKEK
ncbi:hypothetical protein R2APBS1_2851 [Rhodanobacter denitrificans]|uniref:DUF7210 domain-containing protein n=2 Tax=Rhodanobacter denitrificans TaxID=666685 RepID=M4NJR9_9GAMM|nr:hypothetical protein R2APBS1_2851 [Rhodanobacter denitrificans]